MLITKQQQFILDALEKAGGLREDQIVTLLCKTFCAGKPEAASKIAESALRQLLHCNVRLSLENHVFFLPEAGPEERRLDAVDVMLQLAGGKPIEFWRGKPPVLLRFYVLDQKMQIFSVLDAKTGTPDCAFPPQERIILLFDGQGQPQTLPVSNKQFIAIRREDGGFRFFSRDGNQK